MKRSVILIILDGWGIGEKNISNPLWQAKLPTFDYIKKNWPATSLQAAGIAVGMPWGEEGNSEVGHLTLGSGKVLYQYLPRITMAIRNKTFFQNPVFLNAVNHVKTNNSTLHLLGLLSSAQVHSSSAHLEALIDLAAQQGIKNLKIHVICDGRDTGPKEELKFIAKLESKIKTAGIGEIATLCGRFYAMDRDNHWERTEKAYRLYTQGQGKIFADPHTALNEVYKKGLSDEFVEPIVISAEKSGENQMIKNNDAVIFFNFREDSARQLAKAFSQPEFNHFARQILRDLFFATMTQYDETLPLPAAFEPVKITLPLVKILSDRGLRQLHIAETEKYAHITYFFNGGIENPLPGEYRILIPSISTPRFDEHPELSAYEITTRLIGAIEEKIYDFIIVNYANPDVIAHTGNFDAAVKAAEIIDDCVRQTINTTLKNNCILII
ncbi:MAG: 2,3-bisphosphoglycerate-independent phosphoglycerate mutase, partial [bacterium]|nr:2,3-bisphosphoglycerate-independent phosphoglycerate mutase [bacterium]